ncbi:hypothetical protein H5410_031951 [Solanum commersonii]|uniref:Uncharacterized protein n=1 Tax=Solanum commersonii TaxID=4109 RepID=A0A9J5YKQ4_SOLCO|nr:hypothetical protein H5410_031951 [Solanum commersonii]
MEPVSHHGQNEPFSRSNEPRSGIPTSFFLKLTWESVKTLVIELVGHHGQNNPFPWSNEPHSR